MSRVENTVLVDERFQRQEKPSIEGTLKRCDCEIGNLLDQPVLDSEWEEIFIGLHDQIRSALSS